VEREAATRNQVESETKRLGESLKQLRIVAEQNDSARQRAESDRVVKEGELGKALSHLRDEEQRRQEAQLKVQEQMEQLLHVRDALQQAERQRDQLQETVEKQERELGEHEIKIAKLAASSGTGQVSEEINKLAKELERSKIETIEAQKAARAKEQALGDVQQQVEKERHRSSELELQLRFMTEEMEEVRAGVKRASADAKEAASVAKQAAAAVQTAIPGPLPPPGAAPSGPMPAPGSLAPQPSFPTPAPLPPAQQPAAASVAASVAVAERWSLLSSQGADVTPLRRPEEAAAPVAVKALTKGKVSLPSELLNYLNKPNGRSIIINGKRRTGKSNLALGLAEALAANEEDVLLLLTHEPDKRLMDAYGWLSEKRAEDFALFARPNSPDAILQPPSGDAVAARQKLVDAVKAVRGEGGGLPRVLDRPRSFRITTERISRLLSLNPQMAEIINLYDAVERLLPAKVVIIVDRADSLARKYGIEYKSLVEVLQRDLVRGANCDLIIVQERDDQHSADKSVDGVLVMRDISRTEDFLGEIAIANLTDVVLKRPRALYRFEEGRIRMIESADVGSGMEGD
jgi:hypothetical protein